MLAAWCLYLWRLGMVPLRDWDEGTIASVARGMATSGDWLYPTLYDGPYLNKPPLVEWLMATGYMGGVSEWTSRLLPAMVSALAVPLLYWIGREVFGQRRPALLSAGVFLTLLPVVRHSRLAMRDGVAVTLFLLLLLAGLKARKCSGYALGVGICLGLIALTKGILVLLLGTIALVFFSVQAGTSLFSGQRLMLSQGSKGLRCSLYLGLGLVLGSLPVVLWYGAQLGRYGDVYWQGHFVAQSLDRVTSVIEDHQHPPWYYLLELLKYSWPWLIFWPGGILLAWRQRQRPWGQLVLVGTGIYLGAISLMGTKLPWYIMPLYPFVALAIGGYLHHCWQKPPRWAVGFFALIAVVALGGGLYLGIADQHPTLITIGIVLGLSVGWTGWQLWRRQLRWCLTLMVGLYCTLLLLLGSDFWLWELNEAYGVKPVALLINQSVPTAAEVVTTFSYGRPSLNFYCDRYIPNLSGQPLLDRWQENIYVLAEAQHLADLPPHREIGRAEGMVLIQTMAQ
ncbi:glycosyltransferase family 39 protein [Leptothoe spongobia TAU-MAC 1115]|uniref:Glycosyltransferase family 39 protein n=2 Tax=Leptothoe TaxID=2651725 RepID=A0A947DDV0_9CYAN|nr:glycosyltransferase family 39 protein [Leptothoe spongobia TAU-MAC 1115]